MHTTVMKNKHSKSLFDDYKNETNTMLIASDTPSKTVNTTKTSIPSSEDVLIQGSSQYHMAKPKQ